MNPGVREAAEHLGSVFRLLRASHQLPAGVKLVPGPERDLELGCQFRVMYPIPDYWLALTAVEYDLAYSIAVPALERAAAAWVQTRMKDLQDQLRGVRAIVSDAGEAEQIHALTRTLVRWSGEPALVMTETDRRITDGFNAFTAAASHNSRLGVHPRLADLYVTPGNLLDALVACGPPPVAGAQFRLPTALPAVSLGELRESLRRRLAMALGLARRGAATGPELRRLDALTLLLAAPDGDYTIRAFHDSALAGAARAGAVLDAALAELRTFSGTIELHTDRIWRYPLLLPIAAGELGLGGNRDFVDFAVELCSARAGLGAGTVAAAGLLLFGLAVVLAPWTVALVALEIVGALLAANDVWQTYMREREADIAYGLSSFLPEAQRFATTPPSYGGTALGLALALLGNLALLRGVAKFPRLVRGRGAAPPLPPPALAPKLPATTPFGDRLVTRPLSGLDEVTAAREAATALAGKPPRPVVERVTRLRPADPLGADPTTAGRISRAERCTDVTSWTRGKTEAVGERALGSGISVRRRQISGWTEIPERPAPIDPSVVKQHADTIGHHLKPAGAADQVRRGGFPGKYHASHAEKQQILAWPNEAVGVNAPMCDDCIGFFQREAAFRGQRQVVSDPLVTRVFEPDGMTITEYWRSGVTVRVGPGGAQVR